MSLSDDIFKEAAELTGKTPSQLRAMAEQMFASMLSHAMNDPARPIWTAMTLNPFTVEVDIPRRRPAITDTDNPTTQGESR